MNGKRYIIASGIEVQFMPLQKRFIFLPLLLFIFVGCGKEIFQEKETADWPMVNKNLARTGSYGKPAVPPLQLKWKFQTNGPILSSPAVVNGIVYFFSNDSCCYAIDAHSGKLRWKKDVEFRTYGDSSPVVSKGVVYCGKGFALKAETGETIWHNPQWGYDYAPFVQDSAIYYAGKLENNSLTGGWFKVDTKTGKELLWFNTT